MNLTLASSKTLWGFGIAIVLYVARLILEQNGIIIPNTVFDAVLEIVTYVAGLYGIYGIRDALRKIQIEKYYQDSGKVQPKDTSNNTF